MNRDNRRGERRRLSTGALAACITLYLLNSGSVWAQCQASADLLSFSPSVRALVREELDRSSAGRRRCEVPSANAGRTALCLGELTEKTGRKIDSKPHYETALSRLPSSAPAELSRAHRGLAAVEAARGNYASARTHLQSARTLGAANDPRLEAELHLTSAAIAIATGDRRSGLSDLEVAEGLFKQVGLKDRQAVALLRVAQLAQDRALAETTRGMVCEAMQLCKAARSASCIGWTWSALAQILLSRDSAAATRLLSEARAVADALGNEELGANARFWALEIRRVNGENPIAEYKQLAEQFSRLQDPVGEVQSLLGYAQAARAMSNFSLAGEQLTQALRITSDKGTVSLRVDALLERGDLHRTGGDLAAAEADYRSARDAAHAIANARQESRAELSLGETATLSSDKATHFTSAKSLAIQADDPTFEAWADYDLGRLALANRDFDTARSKLKGAADKLRAIGASINLGYALGALCEVGVTRSAAAPLDECIEAVGLLDGEPSGQADVLVIMGKAKIGRGDVAEGRRDFAKASTLLRESGQEAAAAVAGCYANSWYRWCELRTLAKNAGNWSRKNRNLLAAVALVPALFLGLAFIRSRRAPGVRSTELTGWYKADLSKADSDAVFVFVHGIFSSSRACWTADNGAFWPDLVLSDPRFSAPAVFLADYYTSVNSGIYRIRDAAQHVLSTLRTADVKGREAPLNKKRIVFVAHSTGGIVARTILDEDRDLFQDKEIGLVLVASPSRGSAWANRLRFLHSFYGNHMARELERRNPFLKDSEIRFQKLLADRSIPILKGIDLFEHHFILPRPSWWPAWLPRMSTRMHLVDAEETTSFFGAPRIVPDTDHFTVAKPETLQHASHQYLWEFYSRAWPTTSVPQPGPNERPAEKRHS